MGFTLGISLLVILALVGVVYVFNGIGQGNKDKRVFRVRIGAVLVIGGLLVGFLGPMAIANLGKEVTFTEGGLKLLSAGIGGAGTGEPPAQTKTCSDGSVISISATCPNKPICAVEDTTVTLSAQDKYTSVSSGGNHRYRINGAPAKTVADAGTLTASPYNTLEILWMNESKTGYFAKSETFEVPCDGTVTFSTDVVKNGTITTKVFSTDNTLLSDSVSQSLVFGSSENLAMTVEGNFQKDIPYGMVRVIEYNKTTLSTVKILDLAGDEITTAPKPNAFSPTLGVDSATVTYLMPEMIGSVKKEYQLHLEAANAGSKDPASLDSNLTIKDFVRTYYINEDTGASYSGPAAEDEDNTVTRTGQFTTNIPIS